MLVPSRKVKEELVIGKTIRVVVLKVAGGRVKLGVVAPEEVRVGRAELLRDGCRSAWPLVGSGSRPGEPDAVSAR